MNDTSREPHGLGGWLLVLCLSLLAGGPLRSALIAATALPALAVRGPSLAIGLIALTMVTAIGIAAGIALTARRGSAVVMTAAALVLSAAMDLVVYLSHYFPSNRMPGDTPFYVAASLMYHAGWLGYLVRSKRVRNTY